MEWGGGGHGRNLAEKGGREKDGNRGRRRVAGEDGTRPWSTASKLTSGKEKRRQAIAGWKRAGDDGTQLTERSGHEQGRDRSSGRKALGGACDPQSHAKWYCTGEPFGQGRGNHDEKIEGEREIMRSMPREGRILMRKKGSQRTPL